MFATQGNDDDEDDDGDGCGEGPRMAEGRREEDGEAPPLGTLDETELRSRGKNTKRRRSKK